MLFAGLAAAQWSAPVLGLVHDAQDRSLRLIQGVPGAARVSQPLATEVDRAWVAPDGRMALVLSGERLSLVKWDGQDYPLSISEWLGRPSAAAWSADASALALHFRSCECVRTVKRPARPEDQPAELATLPAALEDVQTLAMNGDGELVVASNSEGLWRLRPGRMPELIYTASIRFVEFGPGDRLYTLQSDAAIMHAGNVRGEGAVQFEAYPVEFPDTAQLSGFALARDERELIAADGETGQVFAFDLNSGALKGAISAEGPADTLVPLSSRHFVVSAGTASEPARVVETGREMRLFFIPARGEN